MGRLHFCSRLYYDGVISGQNIDGCYDMGKKSMATICWLSDLLLRHDISTSVHSHWSRMSNGHAWVPEWGYIVIFLQGGELNMNKQTALAINILSEFQGK